MPTFNSMPTSGRLNFVSALPSRNNASAPAGQEQPEQKELRVPKKMLGRRNLSRRSKRSSKQVRRSIDRAYRQKRESLSMPMYVRTSRRTSSTSLKWNPDKSQAKESYSRQCFPRRSPLIPKARPTRATKHEGAAQAGTDRAYHGAGTKSKKRKKRSKGNENVIRHH